MAARRAPPGVEVEMREFNPPPSASDASVCPPPAVLSVAGRGGGGARKREKEAVENKNVGVLSGPSGAFYANPDQRRNLALG